MDALSVRAAIDAAFRSWLHQSDPHDWDCAANSEGQACCIDHTHGNYGALLDHLATALAGTDGEGK